MDSVKDIAQTLNSSEIKVLLSFEDCTSFQWDQLLSKSELSEGQFRSAVELLKTRGALESVEEASQDFVSLTELGVTYADDTLPELKILAKLKESPDISSSDLRGSFKELTPEEIGSAIGTLRKTRAIDFEKDGSVTMCEGKDTPFSEAQALLEKIKQADALAVDELSPSEQEQIREGSKKRGKKKGLFSVKTVKTIRLNLQELGKKTVAYLNTSGITGEEVTRLTPQMLADGSWEKVKFRKFNISLKPSRIVVGKMNAYRQYLDFLQRQLISMGFIEMRGSVVEPEFWNMDALFMPQFHSAREIHDVYFIKEPHYAKGIKPQALKNVAAAHENGGTTGSKGWGYKFDQERTKRLILRSQGTVLSARQLSEGPQIPGKYFAIARCFRYDQVDASHAPDFFQVEGIVVDHSVTFKTLLGLLETFAVEIARAKDVKFVPAYFPFTEPSVEVHMKHPRLGWMELGGSGIFRPEVTQPLGVDAPVLAWGLGIDRMAMVALGIDDIRDLFSSDLEFLRNTRVKGTL